MKTLKFINKKTGKVDAFDMEYVKSYPDETNVAKMRAREDHEYFSMLVEFDERMPFGLAMYKVDDYDMVVEG